MSLVPIAKLPLILSLETATRAGSVVLSRGEQALAARAGEAQTSHSTMLLQTIASVLEAAGASLSDVELFAAASGPGSFTGLRIGLATVKSFAATLGVPCLGIPTLEAVAHAAGPAATTLAMIPAGRGELFAQLLAVDEQGRVTPLNQATHQAPLPLLDDISKFDHLKFAGEGAQQYHSLIQAKAESLGFSLLDESATATDERRNEAGVWFLSRPVETLAASVGALAHQRYLRGEALEAWQLQAIYVRPADAVLPKQE